MHTIRLEHLAPSQIAPDPNNPRGKLRGIDELTDSVKLHGILQPITVRPDLLAPAGDHRYIVVTGHRRLAAAVAANLETVPCIVRELDNQIVRAEQRLVENEQHDDFNMAELVTGVQQLLDLGVSTEHIAEALSTPHQDILDIKSVADSKVAKRLTEKHDLTFDQALALAEFDHDKEIVEDLTQTALTEPEYFEHAASNYREERESQRRIHELTTTLENDGRRVIENPGYRTTKVTRIDELKDDKGKKLTPAGHKKCPGSVVYISDTYQDARAIEACDDPAKYGHTNAYGGRNTTGQTQAELSDDQKEAATAKRRTHKACIDAGRAAEPVRRAFVTQLLARKAVPKGILRFTVECMLEDGNLRYSNIFSELTGTTNSLTDAKWRFDAEEEYLKHLAAGRELLVLTARGIANIEGAWEANTWDSESRKTQRVRYLTWLSVNGYTTSTIERVILDEAKPATVLAEQEKIRAAAKASKNALVSIEVPT